MSESSAEVLDLFCILACIESIENYTTLLCIGVVASLAFPRRSRIEVTVSGSTVGTAWCIAMACELTCIHVAHEQ